MMRLLAIDTAASLCQACALVTNGPALAHPVVLDIGKGHVEHLVDTIEQALRLADCTYADLDRVVTSIGPGSFTGVRVGVAAARGFALALAIPAIGISTLDALAFEARAAHPGRPVLVAIDARRGEAYWAAYDDTGNRIAGPGIAAVAQLAAGIAADYPVLAGDAAPFIAEALDTEGPQIGPVSATANIVTYAEMGTGLDPSEKPRPLYLRAPDAKSQLGFAVPRAVEQ